MTLLTHHFICQDARLDENGRKGIAQLTEEHDATDGPTTEAERVLSSIDLRHDFAKEQQEERQQNSDEQELQPVGAAEVNDVRDEIVEQHDDGDVHQIVGNQYRRQRPLRILAQLLDFDVLGSAFFVEFVQIAR